MLTQVLLDDPARLRALSVEWAALLERSASGAITQHPAWTLPWWDVYGDSASRALRSVAFYDGGVLVGLAPLVARPHVHRPGLRFRRLEPLASGEDEADETCSVYLGLLAARGSEREVAAAFARALASRELGAWDELVLPALNAESELVSTLERELAQQRLLVSLDDYERAPYARLPETFEAYLDLLEAKRRAQLEKWLAALEAWCGAPPALVHVRTPEQLREARRILEALHREHWPEGGVYRSARFCAFHERVMPGLLANGALDVGWLDVRGRPVAAFYNLRWGGRVWHYQSGHARDVPDDVRIGVTLQALLIRAAIEDGAREYDFLAGVLDYKTALAHDTRRLVTLRAARRSVAESARRATEIVTSRARRVRAYAKGKLGQS